MKKLLMIVALMLFAASAHAQFLPPEPEPDCGRPVCKLMKPMIGSEDTDQPDSGGIGPAKKEKPAKPIKTTFWLDLLWWIRR